jgi:hypothetical protein
MTGTERQSIRPWANMCGVEKSFQLFSTYCHAYLCSPTPGVLQVPSTCETFICFRKNVEIQKNDVSDRPKAPKIGSNAVGITFVGYGTKLLLDNLWAFVC